MTLRRASDVHGRVLALRAILWRTQFEIRAQQGAPRAKLELDAERMNLWVATSQVPVSPLEREMLDRPFGGWQMPELAALAWRMEAAIALLWCLAQLEMPPYTEAVPPNIAFDYLERAAVLVTPSLRPELDVARETELASLWNWRARTETLRRQGMQPPPGDSFDATIARATRSASDMGLVTANDDLVVDGSRYADVAHERFVELSCIALERHWALAWLGNNTAWDLANPPT